MVTSQKSEPKANMQKLLRFLRGSLTFFNGLVVVVLVLILIVYIIGNFRMRNMHSMYPQTEMSYDSDNAVPAPKSLGMAEQPAQMRVDTAGANQNSTTGTDSQRMKTYNASISSIVKNVNTFSKDIKGYVKSAGGYIVYDNISVGKPRINPRLRGVNSEGMDKVYNLYISVRIPTTRLTDFVKYVKDKSAEVVSVDINGNDITEQYEDLNRELALYEKTYSRLQNIYDKATTPTDLMRIQDRLLQTQRNIDRIKGRINAMEKESKYARVSIRATTDKYSLSFMPANIWDLKTTTKLATRGLFITVSAVVKLLIWIVVFIPIWLPIVLLVKFGIKKVMSLFK